MTRKSVGLLAIAITFATITGLGVSSCDSNNTPTSTGTNGGGVDRSKTPQVLEGNSNVSYGITNTPNGAATVGYNDDGAEVFNGLNGVAGNSVDCIFGTQANVWRGTGDIDFPQVGGTLTYASKDADGNVEAQVDLAEQGGRYKVFPTFTSAPGAGEAQYDAIIYNNGTEVGRQDAIAATNVVWINPNAACTLKVTLIGWDVYQVNAQCAWRFGLNPCCTYQFQLPNGQIINGNSIKLVERNSNGVYVYTQTKKITTSGNVANYTLTAASAYSK